jgi:hypothetical protein
MGTLVGYCCDYVFDMLQSRTIDYDHAWDECDPEGARDPGGWYYGIINAQWASAKTGQTFCHPFFGCIEFGIGRWRWNVWGSKRPAWRNRESVQSVRVFISLTSNLNLSPN